MKRTHDTIASTDGIVRAMDRTKTPIRAQWKGGGRRIHWILRETLGCCPHCARRGSWAWSDEVRIYRSSERSVTLQCKTCGLQWTMTIHQIAKAAERWGLSDKLLEGYRAWAAAVPEHRGRSSAP